MNEKIKFIFFLLVLFLTILSVNAVEVNNSEIEDTVVADTLIDSGVDYTSDEQFIVEDKAIEKKYNYKENIKESSNETHNRIIINSTTFNDYVTDGKLNDKVNPGDVLDVRGLLDSKYFDLTVDKPVNITSTTNNSWGASDGMRFTINKNGSGTNVSNINFFQTKICVKNTTDVIIDNITNICKDVFINSINNVEEISKNIKILNSYFYCENIDTWSCNFKVSGVDGLLVENCTFIEVGYCMNTVYLQIQYNMEDIHKVNNNITLRNCVLDGSNAVSQAASCGLVMQGTNIIIENNTIRHNSTNTIAGSNYLVMGVWIDLNWGTDNEGELVADTGLVNSLIFRDNTLEGDYIEGGEAIFSAFSNATIYNNTFINTTAYVGDQQVYNNTFENVFFNKNTTDFTNNVVKGWINVSRNSNMIINNTLLGLTNITGINNTLQDNKIFELNIDSDNNQVQNNKEVIYIYDDNIGEYADVTDNQAKLFSNIQNNSEVFVNLRDNIKVLNITQVLDNVNFTLLNQNLYHVIINNESSQISFINSYCPQTSIEIYNNHEILNSTFLDDIYLDNGIVINSTLINGNNVYNILSSNSSIDKLDSIEQYFDSEGYLTDMNVTNLIFRNTPSISQNNQYNKQLIINRPINITSWDNASYNANISFVKGSEGSNITNLRINGSLLISADNISVKNNNITKTIYLNDAKSNNLMENNITGDILGVSLMNSSNNKIFANNINTTNNYTIYIDSSSQNNEINKNILISDIDKNIYSIKQENMNNDIWDNYPKFKTNITIDMANTTIINDTESAVDLTLSSEKEMVGGDIVISLNGEPKKQFSITNESNITATITFDRMIGTSYIQVHYYPEDLYENSTAQKKVTVKKIRTYLTVSNEEQKLFENSTITANVFDEFGNKVQEGTVIFTINDINLSSEVKDGIAAVSLYSSEEYKGTIVLAKYLETSSRTQVINKTVFNTLKGDSFISLTQATTDNLTTINATVTNKIGQTITSGYVQFTGSNISKLVKIENGQASLIIPSPAQNTIITATFRNNPNYESSSSNITVNSKQQVIVSYETLPDVNFGDNVTVTGNFTTIEGKIISNANVKVVVNGVKNYAKTDRNGVYSYTFVATVLGVNNISVGYSGNAKYEAYETNATFNVVGKMPVVVTYEPIGDVNFGENVTITGQFMTTTGKAITNSNVKIFINGVKYLAKTDRTGTYLLSVQTNMPGTNNVTLGYSGNAKYEAYETATTFNVVGKMPVVVTYEPIGDVNFGDNVTVTGNFTTSNGKAITNANVKVVVNGVKNYAKTDRNGVYSFIFQADTVGVNEVTVGYSGNAKYEAYETATTFNVVGKMPVVVTYEPIGDVNFGDNVTITGKFTTITGKAITNANVKILINGVKYYAKTDKTGTYVLSVETTVAGVNTVVVGYSGNSKYEAYETTTTFNVLGKQPVVVTYEPISNVVLGNNVTITGKFTTSTGKAITNANVKILINGVKYYAKTDKNGVYIFSLETTVLGNNNVTLGYSGNDKYESYETSTTFKVIA